jgi:hypothetical protein
MSIQEKINQLSQAALCRDETRDTMWRPVTFIAPSAVVSVEASGELVHRWTSTPGKSPEGEEGDTAH